VIHFIWLVKADLRRPLTYGVILGVLLVFRATVWAMSRWRTRQEVAARVQSVS
jgi:methionine sulfoxide reductase heme-binding subunit